MISCITDYNNNQTTKDKSSNILTLDQIAEEQSKEKRLGYVTDIVRCLMPQLPYHKFQHAMDVYSMAMTCATLEKISPDDRFILATAAMMHDVIFKLKAKDNEERSAELARIYLPQIGYTKDQTEKVSRIVLATKMPTNPKALLEEIICDSDVDNIGRDDFLAKNELIREELGIPESYEWYKENLRFLKSQKFYTASARKYRGYGLEHNIKMLQDICNAYRADHDDIRRT